MTTAPPAAGAGPAVPPVDRALKRERFGWYSYDWAMSVFNTSVTTVFLGPYLTAIAEDAAGADGRLPFLGICDRRRAAGSPTCCRLSVLLQVLVLPAHRRGRRPHRPQAARCWPASRSLGALATTAMFFVADER